LAHGSIAIDPLRFGALSAAPTLAALVPFQVLRRAGDFAITRPTREVLFTVLPREDRYKLKSFIDTVMYRLDQVGAWAFTLMLGWGTRSALVAIPLSAAWLANALWLGRRQGAMAGDRSVRDRREATADDGGCDTGRLNR
jgi:ATP:ADP antiporter, AAA family